MNKSATIQLIFIIIGILSFWEGLQYLIGNFIVLLSSFFETGSKDYLTWTIFSLLLVSCAYFLLAYLLIKNSAEWSKWCAEKSQMHDDFRIVTSVTSILYIVFLMVGIYSLIKTLPHLLEKFFLAFESKASRYSVNNPTNSSWFVSIFNALLPALVVLFARNLAEYFSRKLNTNDLLEISEINSSQDIL